MVGFVALLFPWLSVTSMDWNEKVRDKEAYAKQLANDYCTSAKTIVSGTKGNFKIGNFTSSNKVGDLVDAFGDYVHENYHSFNWSFASFNKRYYYIDDETILSVESYDVFNSHKVNSIVPDKLEKEIFRYDTYVGSREDLNMLDSKTNGIFGLLEEYAAYYQGSKASLELYPYLQKTFGYSNKQVWHEYLTRPTSSLYALYEFKLFISWYLQYAQKHDKALYHRITHDDRLKLVYTVISSRFEDELEKYFLMREAIIAHYGNSFKLKDEYLYIDADGDGWHEKGFGVPDTEIDFLKSILAQPEHAILENIRLSDTEMNRMLLLAKK